MGKTAKIEKSIEKKLEKRFTDRIAKLGGLSIKFSSYWFTGLPDRIALLPGGRILFVEFKDTGKKPTALQISAMQRLKLLGFDVDVIDSEETFVLYFQNRNL